MAKAELTFGKLGSNKNVVTSVSTLPNSTTSYITIDPSKDYIIYVFDSYGTDFRYVYLDGNCEQQHASSGQYTTSCTWDSANNRFVVVAPSGSTNLRYFKAEMS